MADEQKKGFDPANKDDVKVLQGKLNEFNALRNSTQEPLDITGEMDKATRAAWLEFKKETFADGSLSIGYLKDKKGLNFSEKELEALGVSPDALGDKPKNPESYDRNEPPKELITAVQKKLGVEQTGKLNEDTRAAIKDHKRKNWIDGRINAGALNRLDEEIKSLKAAKEVNMTGVTRSSGSATVSIPMDVSSSKRVMG
ncbi:MAG: hypothetical protein KGI29_09530 [Pseudomonadota bacterium]|nr:hypothetical protein [Pseudomonadota bacterium]MDE3036827.1 hypothetical protein [Pseudomonadota bacterium]